ncbi:MAG: energy-coupling factor transporter transmembrane protein EcfT [Spirochaetales bacterium]|nr:energy-coupling factor transporter transmembrane protein EcfT [Spirochaetales bacterium]
MKNLEFFRRVSIGQYLDADSPVHRLTPATKYLWLFALILPASMARSSLAIILVAAACLAAAKLARVHLRYLLRGFGPVLPLVLLTAVLQFVFGWRDDGSLVLADLGPISVTMREVLSVLGMAARFLAIMMALGLFTATTTEGDSARGIEDLMQPLARLGIPAHGLALAVAVAFRFIPIVAGELEAVVKAQAARGADFGAGRGGIVRKVRAYLPLVVPVTVRALERAEALAEAMDARCYRSKGRTRFVVTVGGRGEALLRLSAIVFGAGVMVLSGMLSW